MLPSGSAPVAKRQRPEPPLPGHAERPSGMSEDDEMEDADFRFFDIDTEPSTRARKTVVPRESDGDDGFADDARPPSALDFDSGDVEAWYPFVQERSDQLEDIIRDFRALTEQRQTTNEHTTDNMPQQALYESLLMHIHSERAELAFALGQTDEARYTYPMISNINSEAMITWRTQWQRRKTLRGMVKEAANALGDCYRSLASRVDGRESSTADVAMLARLESARRKLGHAVNPQGNKRIKFLPRVRREKSNNTHKSGTS